MAELLKKMVGIVVIGRNEGERLDACLRSAVQETKNIVYVDSGSTDASVPLAKGFGAELVELDLSIPFTAARARNEGWKKLVELKSEIEYIHFIDGDCEFVEGWLQKAHAFMQSNEQYAVVCGQRKERYPEQSIYNALCDIEWNTPVGNADACGGDALIRVAALQEVGGYPEDFIAGEEPEMCFRLRDKGWKIHRLEGIMTLHDAAITKFSQWWKRTKRCGFAYALGFNQHGKSQEQYQKKEVYRVLVWGGLIPMAILVASIMSQAGLLLLLLYPVQYIRLVKSSVLQSHKHSWVLFNILGKFPEFFGVVEFYWKKLFNKQMKLIEYK